MLRPIRATFTIPYGAQFGAVRANGLRRHNGTDYHTPIGTPIYGTDEGGVVQFIGFGADPWIGPGHYVVIRYLSGRTTDMHMRERTLLRVGQDVGPTTLIGFVGITGNAVNASPPGSHLHHERRKPNGLLVNPEEVYRTQLAADNITPIVGEDDDMFTDTDRYISTQVLAKAAANELALYRIEKQLLPRILDAVERTQWGVNESGLRQTVASLPALIATLSGGVVESADLDAAVAKLNAIAATVPTVGAIAVAVNDEDDARELARLQTNLTTAQRLVENLAPTPTL